MPPADPQAAKLVLSQLGADTWLAASMLYTAKTAAACAICAALRTRRT
jgi:hypothetical protein